MRLFCAKNKNGIKLIDSYIIIVKRYRCKLTTRKFHTDEKVPQSKNRKIIERGNIDNPNTQIHDL